MMKKYNMNSRFFYVSSQPNFNRLNIWSISFSFYRMTEEMCKEHIHIQKKEREE